MTEPLRPVPDPPPEVADVADVPRTRSDPGRGAELIRRTALGDTTAFEELYRLFAARVYGLALRVVRDPGQAEEVAQETFLQVWQRASRFDQGRGSAAAWVLALTHGRAVDRVRSAQSAADREDAAARTTTQREVDTVTEAVEHHLERRAVRHCLDALTELQCQSVTLAYYHGYSYPQVAELLHTPLPTIKTRMRDGLIRLRDCLKVTL